MGTLENAPECTVGRFLFCPWECLIFLGKLPSNYTADTVKMCIGLGPVVIHVRSVIFEDVLADLFYLAVDGAYFGTSFPHLFFQQFKQCVPKKSPDHYIPKIFGFKLYSETQKYTTNNHPSTHVPDSQQLNDLMATSQ